MSRKGILRVTEVMLSIVIVIAMMLLMAYVSPMPEPRTFSSPPLRTLAMSVLRNLDERGYLSKMVYSEDWVNLTREFNTLLPPNICYNVTIYSHRLETTQITPVVVTESIKRLSICFFPFS